MGEKRRKMLMGEKDQKRRANDRKRKATGYHIMSPVMW